jgi:hypothetical protein
MSAIFSDPRKAHDFIIAGNATLTIKSLKTGDHITYRVRKSQDGRVFFVSVRTGGPGEKLFAYMGTLPGERPDHAPVKLTGKSKYALGDREPRAFNWLWGAVCEGVLPPQAEVRHEGTCGRCARPLTDPESIDRGFGPECWSKLH